jgi:hypothetical protein
MKYNCIEVDKESQARIKILTEALEKYGSHVTPRQTAALSANAVNTLTIHALVDLKQH